MDEEVRIVIAVGFLEIAVGANALEAGMVFVNIVGDIDPEEIGRPPPLHPQRSSLSGPPAGEEQRLKEKRRSARRPADADPDPGHDR